jgi:hypothetical protein
VLLTWSTTAVFAGKEQLKTSIPAALVGSWEEQGGSRRLNIEPDQTIEREGNKLTVRGLIRSDASLLVLRNLGESETWAYKIEKGRLTLEPRGSLGESSRKGTFQRLDQVPPDLKLEPLPVATPKSLTPANIQAITQEIKTRFESEQALLKSPTPPKEKIALAQEDNLAYLTNLLGESGWVDSARFGSKTSVYAVIMAKHTHDLRLMMTLLPYAEHDLKDSGDGQTYAVLYDGLQLELGKKQLYGTQVAKDKRDGHFYVLPMQESKREVNRRLRDMGLPNIDEYLSVFRQTFGQKVQCCRQDG